MTKMCMEPEGYDQLHLSASRDLQTLRVASLQKRLTLSSVSSQSGQPLSHHPGLDHDHQLKGAGKVEWGHSWGNGAGDRAILILFATQNG